MKKVAIITINYNHASGLERTIKSVLCQKNGDYEFIIIDGDSNDGSKELIKKYQSEITFSISEKDNGIYNAQNKGWRIANSEYCLFINSGDSLADDNVLNDFNKYLNGSDIVYGNMLTNDEKGKITQLISPQILDVPFFMVSTIWHPTAFIKRELFQKYGGYSEKFKITGDYEFFIRTILKYQVTTLYFNRNVSLFCLDGLSNSIQHKALHKNERVISWQMNFSERVIKVFENYTQILRSREYKMAKVIKVFKSKFIK